MSSLPWKRAAGMYRRLSQHLNGLLDAWPRLHTEEMISATNTARRQCEQGLQREMQQLEMTNEKLWDSLGIAMKWSARWKAAAKKWFDVAITIDERNDKLSAELWSMKAREIVYRDLEKEIAELKDGRTDYKALVALFTERRIPFAVVQGWDGSVGLSVQDGNHKINGASGTFYFDTDEKFERFEAG